MNVTKDLTCHHNSHPFISLKKINFCTQLRSICKEMKLKKYKNELNKVCTLVCLCFSLSPLSKITYRDYHHCRRRAANKFGGNEQQWVSFSVLHPYRQGTSASLVVLVTFAPVSEDLAECKSNTKPFARNSNFLVLSSLCHNQICNSDPHLYI